MITKLAEIYCKLANIRKNLIKLSYDRRKPELLNTKLDEASVIYAEYLGLTVDLDEFIKKQPLGSQQLLDIQYRCDSIKSLYSEIDELCSRTYTSSSGENKTSKSSKMSDFDLKVALSLIPVMTDDEAVIKQLIDSIDYYDSLLNPVAKQSLINFVLKNRITQVAKMKLSARYASVQDLLKDMRKHLLPKKSATAIQNKMQSLRQGETSIDVFGQQLTDMFVNLTIAQSDGNTDAYQILKDINEKQAIKRFADGLRNRRVGTIIAARNYESLKDAVQGALDEETSAGTSGDLYSYNHQRINHFSRGYARGRGARGGSFCYRGPRTQYYQTRTPHYQASAPNSTTRGGSRGTNFNQARGRRSRGRSNYFRGNNGYRNDQIRVIEESNNDDNIIPNQFFRE